MNNKFILIFCTVIFILATAIVVVTNENTMKNRKVVQFSNQIFNISNESSSVKSNNKIVINNATNEISDKKINVNNDNSEIKSQNITYENSNIDNNSKRVNIDFKNLDDSKLNEMIQHPDMINNNPKSNNRAEVQQPPVKKQIDRYLTKQIDWNTWKNNFRNKILDDSLDLTYLDTYPIGSSLYYSFTVDSTGAISDIVVTSRQLTVKDKLDFREFIKGYQYQPITKFPPYTNITKQKVSATIVLSDTTEHANFKEFNGIEHVKIKY